DDLVLARENRLRGERRRLEPGAARLVDGERRNRLGTPSLQRRSARWADIVTRLNHAAEDHFADVLRRDGCTPQALRDRACAERLERHVFGRTAEAADGGPTRAQNEHILHGLASLARRLTSYRDGEGSSRP